MGEGISRDAAVNMEKKTMSIKAPLIDITVLDSEYLISQYVINFIVYWKNKNTKIYLMNVKR